MFLYFYSNLGQRTQAQVWLDVQFSDFCMLAGMILWNLIFVVISVTTDQPAQVSIHKVKKVDKDNYKKRQSWLLSELKIVDGKDPDIVSSFQIHIIYLWSYRFSNAFWLSRTIIGRCWRDFNYFCCCCCCCSYNGYFGQIQPKIALLCIFHHHKIWVPLVFWALLHINELMSNICVFIFKVE